MLPPGQSGYVSLTGVASGTGSPHLTDQNRLFIDFRFKPALLRAARRERRARGPGVTIVRGLLRRAGGHRRQRLRRVVGRRLRGGAGPAVPARGVPPRHQRAAGGDARQRLARRRPDRAARLLHRRRDRRAARQAAATLLRRAEAYRDGINAYIAEVRANPLELPGEFPALGVAPADWTLRDTGRVGSSSPARFPPATARSWTTPARCGGSARRRSRRCCRCARGARSPPCRAGTASSRPSPDGPRRQESARSVARAPSWGPEAARERRRRPGAARPAARTCGRSGPAKPRGRKRRRGPGPAYLFNGPQLGFSIPELFVEFELHSPVQDVRGVSAAGVPVIGIGHNGHVAWGFTSGPLRRGRPLRGELTGRGELRVPGPDAADGLPRRGFDYRAAADRACRTTSPAASRPARARETVRICRTVHGPVQARAEAWPTPAATRSGDARSRRWSACPRSTTPSPSATWTAPWTG